MNIQNGFFSGGILYRVAAFRPEQEDIVEKTLLLCAIVLKCIPSLRNYEVGFAQTTAALRLRGSDFGDALRTKCRYLAAPKRHFKSKLLATRDDVAGESRIFIEVRPSRETKGL